jgi:Lar family restriction alleviation protein
MSELRAKRCPFCGSTDVFATHDLAVHAECNHCEAKGPLVRYSGWETIEYDKTKAIEAWNKRI